MYKILNSKLRASALSLLVIIRRDGNYWDMIMNDVILCQPKKFVKYRRRHLWRHKLQTNVWFLETVMTVEECIWVMGFHRNFCALPCLKRVFENSKLSIYTSYTFKTRYFRSEPYIQSLKGENKYYTYIQLPCAL